MEKKDLRIVYMGTPEFAVESLKSLYENGYNVVGVVTMPDKPAGRGHKLQSSPVKQYAESVGLKIMQPEKLKDQTFLQELQNIKADLQIVVAFRMLPEVVWNMPKLGTFNLHGSLLPQYRGAAPINWAIINGEKETGVTTFFLQHDIDTGNIILQDKTTINDTDNLGTVYERLKVMGANIVLKTVDMILDGTAKGNPQHETRELKSAPKIFKETCKIHWENSADEINNLIRGLSPSPGAWTVLTPMDEADETEPIGLKIYEAEAEMTESKEDIGTLVITKDCLKVSCGTGYLKILSAQMAGKKRMNIKDILNGYPINHYFVQYKKDDPEEVADVTTSITNGTEKLGENVTHAVKSVTDAATGTTSGFWGLIKKLFK